MSNNIFSVERKIIDLNSKDMFSIETFTELQKFTDLDEKTKTARGVNLIDFDTISRNRSLYEGNSIIDSIQNSEYIQERVRADVWFGELEHPPINCSRDRFVTIDPTNICHKIKRYQIGKEGIVGDVQYMRPRGPDVWEWITTGSNMALSVRILTPNYEETKDSDGNPYMRKFGKMQMITFDTVAMPGFATARLADNNKYDATKVSSFEGIHCNWTEDRKKDEFVSLLKSQETLPIMQAIYGFELCSDDVLSYSNEGFITVKVNNTKTIKIPSDVMNVNRVLGLG